MFIKNSLSNIRHVRAKHFYKFRRSPPPLFGRSENKGGLKDMGWWNRNKNPRKLFSNFFLVLAGIFEFQNRGKLIFLVSEGYYLFHQSMVQEIIIAARQRKGLRRDRQGNRRPRAHQRRKRSVDFLVRFPFVSRRGILRSTLVGRSDTFVFRKIIWEGGGNSLQKSDWCGKRPWGRRFPQRWPTLTFPKYVSFLHLSFFWLAIF